LKQNTYGVWRTVVGATLLSSSLYGCGGGSGQATDEPTSENNIDTASSSEAPLLKTQSSVSAGINTTDKMQTSSQIPTVEAALPTTIDTGIPSPPPNLNAGTDTPLNPLAPVPISTQVTTPETTLQTTPETTQETTQETTDQTPQIPEREPIPDIADVEPQRPTVDTQAPTGNMPDTRTITIGERAGDVVKILDRQQVSTSQLMVQQTPVDTQHGYVYTANIEHGANGDENSTNLHTVVRQGVQNDDGSWSWSQTLVEDRTVHNQWHTAPSVVADTEGYVHVAYNMHNYPWQYKRSQTPHSIDDFEFRGQAITKAEIDRSKFENKTSFQTNGHADIPGNQITYPAFFKDRNRNIYATYRFAAKPRRSFEQRTMSGGIASYDTQLKSWRAIGGQLQVTEGTDYTAHADAPSAPTSLASDTGWTVYHPRLMFGPGNELHVNWFFRNGIAGAELSKPCYAKSMDTYAFTDAAGSSITLPRNSDDCGNVGYANSQSFYSVGNSAMDASGKPHIVLSPIGGVRQIVSYDNNSGQWTREDTPNNATEIFFDAYDNLWAIATGIRVMVRLSGSSDWNTVYTDPDGGNCFPKVSVNETGDTAFVHTHACDQKSVTIYGVRLN